MKSLASFLIRTLRSWFYNTPVRHWRVTEIVYAAVGRFLVGNEPHPIIQMDGMKLKTNGADVIVTAALMNGNYEPFTLKIFRQLIAEGLAKEEGKPVVFIDVGSNIGVFTVTAARMDSRVQALAFEPNPPSLALLKENLQLNELTNARVIQAAVGETKGSASLDVSSPQAGMHSIYGPGTQRIDVPVVSLDEVLAEQQIIPSVIKVDVEGYEPKVLLGMKQLLSREELRMILEFNPEHLRRGGKEPADFLEELTAQFDSIYCLDEIQQRAIPYLGGGDALREQILGVGYNLLLVLGKGPEVYGNQEKWVRPEADPPEK